MGALQNMDKQSKNKLKKENEKNWVQFFIDNFEKKIPNHQFFKNNERINNCNDSEEPDFILHTSLNRSIGIELSELVKEKQKAIKNEKNVFLTKLESINSDRNIIPCTVDIEFINNAPIDRKKSMTHLI